MSDEKITRDVAVPLPPDSNGNMRIMRVRGTDTRPVEAQVGVLMPVQDGKPIPPGADYVHLKPNGEHFDVDTIYSSPIKPSGGGWKPLSVSPEKFASNWDRIFGKKPDPSEWN